LLEESGAPHSVADFHRKFSARRGKLPYHGSPRERKKERKKEKGRKKKERRKDNDWGQEQNFISVYMPYYFDAYICVWIADKANFKPASLLLFHSGTCEPYKNTYNFRTASMIVGNLKSIRYQTQNYCSPFQLLR